MDYKDFIGLGVAGNFTGHLEQAGEAKDFSQISSIDDGPKGIFPFYVPSSQKFLAIYPLSSDKIIFPNDTVVLQPEPEIALLCNVSYENQKVIALMPFGFASYNDCSIRNITNVKISQKKNWGTNSKGISEQIIPITQFQKGSALDNFRLVCFLKRKEAFYQYGEDSQIKTYSYFYTKLLDWIVNQINTQEDQGPLENISEIIAEANYPTKAVISIGATRYTDFGEKTYLEKGDEIFVISYDEVKYSQEKVMELLKEKNWNQQNISVLHQIVE